MAAPVRPIRRPPPERAGPIQVCGGCGQTIQFPSRMGSGPFQDPALAWEIEAGSAFMEKRAPDSDAETLAFFAEQLGRLSKTREDIKTMFELGELDDYVSFGGKA